MTQGMATIVIQPPSREFGDHDDRQRRDRRRRADGVDDEIDHRSAGVFPCGRGLRNSRRQCATMPACDMVKVRNAPIANSGIKPVGDAVKSDQQQSRGDRQIDDADRIHQTAADGRERPRQELILRHQSAHPRKADEAGIRGQAKNAERAGDRHVIKHAASRDRADELRQHALVAGLRLVHGHDAVGRRQIGNAAEQDA